MTKLIQITVLHNYDALGIILIICALQCVDSTLLKDDSIRSLSCVCCKEIEYLMHMETHSHPILKPNPKGNDLL